MSKTKLDLLLDKVKPGEHELTIHVDGYTQEQVDRIIKAAEARGFNASYDGKVVLVRDLRGALGDDLQVAKTIRDQIGNRAFVMIGARDFVGDKNSLTFRIGRNAQGVTHIRVQLDPSDTYTMQFLKVSRTKKPPYFKRDVVSEASDIYFDQLRRTIELKTGLYTSL